MKNKKKRLFFGDEDEDLEGYGNDQRDVFVSFVL